MLCPYCGHISPDLSRCGACGGHFDPLSRQASQNAMGAWFVRDPAAPFRPGCSFETLRELVRRGKVGPETILRGPTTHQFWTFAARAPSVANLLGRCHNCHSAVDPTSYMCASCGAAFTPETDRQHLGLAPVHLLPGQTTPEKIAASASPHIGSAEAGGPSARIASVDTPVSHPSGESPEISRLRKQLRLQWVAVAVLFVVMTALAAWIAAAAFSGLAPGGGPEVGEAAQPAEQQRPEAATLAPPDPPATGLDSEVPDSQDPGGTQPADEADAATPAAEAAFVTGLTSWPFDPATALLLAGTDGGEKPGAAMRRRAIRDRVEQLSLRELP